MNITRISFSRSLTLVLSVLFVSLFLKGGGLIESDIKKDPPAIYAPAFYDIIIEGGRIIDGTGNPWYFGDIGITNEKIVAIGDLKEDKAKQRIDAKGTFVVPGFIDIHTHSDGQVLNIPTADNSVLQGLTTIVTGNCGGAPLPVGNFLEKVKNAGISINYIALVGHGTVRSKAMGGSKNRPPTEKEMDEMKRIVEQSMKEGAYGMSTGLHYTPGNYAETDELIELAKVVSRYGGIYCSHLRDESDYGIGLLAAVQEAINIGEAADIPVQISHIKCLGKPVWYKSSQVLNLINEGRQKGVNVMFDQYPYTASLTGLWGAVIPAWAQEGGPKEFVKKLDDLMLAEKIRGGIKDNIERRGGPGAIYLIKKKSFLSDLSVSWNVDPVDAAIRVQKEGGSQIISYNMTDFDVENYMQSPYGMIATDGGIRNEQIADHPRSYGAFPRVLEVYVREKHLLTWEEAIRKMTSAPATQLGLTDRGILKPGMVADIVIFDPVTVKGKADYQNPALNPDGIPYVLVNGSIVVENSKHTGARPGKVLLNNK